jgi:hypothetical protein
MADSLLLAVRNLIAVELQEHHSSGCSLRVSTEEKDGLRIDNA